MFKSYIRNTLTFILKQYFVFYKIVHNSLQFFYIFHNNQLKLITLLYIVNIKNVKWQYTLYFKQYWGNSVIWEENKNTLTGPVNCKKTTRHPAQLSVCGKSRKANNAKSRKCAIWAIFWQCRGQVSPNWKFFWKIDFIQIEGLCLVLTSGQKPKKLLELLLRKISKCLILG